MNKEIYDVVQIGYGPVGQTMAALLGKTGQSVAVFERWPSTFSLPRAATFDHEIMRVLQSIGCSDKIEEKIVPFINYHWVNAKRDILLKVPYGGTATSGWENGYLMFQPEIEKALDEAARSYSNVEINLGWQAEELKEHEDYVEVTFRKGEIPEPGKWLPTNETRTVRALYVIGADGANSFTRNKLEIKTKDLGFEAEFLVLDIRPNNPQHLYHLPEGYQICDPARPTTVVSRLGTEHIRFEFMLLPGEKKEDMLDTEKIYELLKEWILPEEGTIIRKTVYRFNSNLAENWYNNRIFLIGDAAHLTPPFMGQGMCSGIRDAKNLAWKLDLVLRNKAEESLFETYQVERYDHCKQLIQMAIDLGKIICIPDEKEAEKRDQAFFSGSIPPFPEMPILTNGILHKNQNGDIISPTGELSLQDFVSYQGETGRFDDIIGQGWTIITTKEDPRNVLTNNQIFLLEQIGAKIVQISNEENKDTVYDLNGKYTKYFNEKGLEAVIVRPDFYNFAGVPTMEELPGIVEDLLSQLHLKLSETIIG
ncbi:bifunctional 3-(3-hydroxy-phenyl)propionate/3-hydroxycinnamic acid hydroxylase [Psychrobacillus sp. NPDC096426]|uniref:bifunctional 3-(3-hydroxy-phenyl)propionate/3-hydroxycinnamic acid hydroxylase MhpA n=1 Tax=Psychrobacillus sp. NPDC096426 TaxID=3364491 RepID=UPI00380E4FAF